MHTYTPEWIRQGATGLGVEVRRRLDTAYRTVGFTYTRATITATRGRIIDLTQLVGRQNDVHVSVDSGISDSTSRVLASLPENAWFFDPDEGCG